MWPRAGIAVLEGPMYAVGGHDGWSYLNTVERWDPQARQWNYVASMSTPRSTVGVTALNGKSVPLSPVTTLPPRPSGPRQASQQLGSISTLKGKAEKALF